MGLPVFFERQFNKFIDGVISGTPVTPNAELLFCCLSISDSDRAFAGFFTRRVIVPCGRVSFSEKC
jgi:hypothetical protein